MTEDYLHYLWRYGLFPSKDLKTEDGLSVRIKNPGQYNRDAGPDFSNAQIYIGDALWIGHVEIHQKASDWNKHGHQRDPNYNQVILHVVTVADQRIHTQKGVDLPVLLIKPRAGHFERYEELVASIDPIPCRKNWQKCASIAIDQAITSMGVDRLQERFRQFHTRLLESGGAQADLAFQVVARAFGFGKNQVNFDLLAQSIPYKVIERHRSNLFQLEALLLGQANLLPDRPDEAYPRALQAEYQYLSRKHNLRNCSQIRWIYKKTRPANQPIRRLMLLAAWLHQSKGILETIDQVSFAGPIVKLEAFPSSYWRHHSDFGKTIKTDPSDMGISATELLYINAFWPLKAYRLSRQSGQNRLSDWVDALENLRPEKNYIINHWKDAGFNVTNAFYSQTFLHLYKNYCNQRRCLHCQLGQVILAK